MTNVLCILAWQVDILCYVIAENVAISLSEASRIEVPQPPAEPFAVRHQPVYRGQSFRLFYQGNVAGLNLVLF